MRSIWVRLLVLVFLGTAGLGWWIGSPPPQPGTHGGGGRIVDGAFVHAHRFQLQQEGQAWRIYQFEEVDAGI